MEAENKRRSRKKSYIGTVLSEFSIRGKVKRVGTKYDCKDKFSYEYLKTQNKIK